MGCPPIANFQNENINSMTTLQTLIIAICLGFISCNGNRTETAINNIHVQVDSVTSDTILISEHKSKSAISDTIKRFTVDDYPITNAMLAEKKNHSGEVWYGNDTLKQILFFELYTDYHRMVTYHFYSNDIPTDLLNKIKPHVDGEVLATEKQKLKYLTTFLNQIPNINSKYFITEKGFRLGDPKQKAIEIYGNPDTTSMNNGIEKFEWKFIGDIFYDGKTELNGKPVAESSFGHQIVMYFRNDKLIAQILVNDIP